MNQRDENGYIFLPFFHHFTRETPLFYAVKSDNPQLMEITIKLMNLKILYDFDVANIQGDQLLHIAVQKLNVLLVQKIIKKMSHVNHLGANHKTALRV